MGSASYTLKPPKREKILLACGVIDLVLAVPLLLVGIGLMLTGAWQGALAFLGGLLALWAGSVMTWGRVYVNGDRLATMQNWPHRAKRGDIVSIDVCRSDFGKIKQVLPIVRLKDGKTFKLPPLCVSAIGPGCVAQSEEQQSQALKRQEMLVGEIRSSLGVGGLDYVQEPRFG